MALSNPGLEELLSPLGFVLTAALSGVVVHIHFQGPAVKVLTKGFQEQLAGIKRPFSGFARAGLDAAGYRSAHHMVRQLQALGERFYLCGGSAEHFGVDVADLAFSNESMPARGCDAPSSIASRYRSQ